MKKIIHLLVLSCQKATFLIEVSYHHPLSFVQKLQLKFHMKICEKCSAYQKQSLLIERILNENKKTCILSTNLKLDYTSKVRIQKVLDEKLNNR